MGHSKVLPILLTCLCTTSAALAFAHHRYKQPTTTETFDFEEQSKIFNGSFAQESYPFFVAIMARPLLSLLGKFELRCGGSLIDNNHVLTAGHCTEPLEKDLKQLIPEHIYEAWLAPTDLSKPPARNRRIPIIGSRNLHTHPLYEKKRTILRNDVGIIQLSQSVEPTKDIYPICLDKSTDKDDLNVTLVGFGMNECRIQSTTRLLIAKGTTLPPLECRTNMPERATCAELTNLDNTYAEMGPGDSGGALFYSENTSSDQITYHQIGLVSYGTEINSNTFPNGTKINPCPNPDAPGIYMIPSMFEDFIKDSGASPTYC